MQKAISGYCIVTPDYESTPFLKVTEDLTLAFWIQMEQLKMLQKYHINGETIRFDDKIAVANTILKASESRRFFTPVFGGDEDWIY